MNKALSNIKIMHFLNCLLKGSLLSFYIFHAKVLFLWYKIAPDFPSKTLAASLWLHIFGFEWRKCEIYVEKMFHQLPLRLYLIQEDGPTMSDIRQAPYLPLRIISTFSRTVPPMQANILACKSYTALCHKSTGSYVTKAEKKKNYKVKVVFNQIFSPL